MAAVATLLASCSKDETTTAPVIERSKVTFTVNAPELSTRAGEGNGTTATQLKYVIYDLAEAEGDNEIYGTADFVNDNDNNPLTTTVTVDLVEGRKYEAIFFAHAEDAPYTIDWTEQTMTINTQSLTANNEKYDAFYKYVEPFVMPATGLTKDVEMTRPFAQLNVATVDYQNDDYPAGKMIDAEKTGVKVSKVYKTLDLKSGEATNETDFEFDLTDSETLKNSAKIKVGNIEYTWLTMNYILVNSRDVEGSSKLVDVEFTFTDTDKDDNEKEYTREYTAVPVERNYRTNIVGTILTSPTEFNVEILPGFEVPDNNVFESDVWDGTTTTALEQAEDENGNKIFVDADGNEVDENETGALPLYEIGDAASFAALQDSGASNLSLAAQRGLSSTFVTRAGEAADGVYIRLTSSIDLANNDWTPIAFNNSENVVAATIPFVGVFDGNGYTIKNLKIHKTNRGGLGLFGAVSRKSTFKNITLENVDILANDTYNEHRSNGDSPAYPNYLSGGQIGALVGYNADDTADLTFENVHVKGLIKIEGEQEYAQGQRIGGVFGGRGSLKGISFKNVTVKGTPGSYIKGFCSVAGVAGQLQGPATFENIQTDIDITANTFGAAGIVGIAQSSTFTNCSVAGDITRTATEDFAGKALSAHSFFRVGGIVGCWSEEAGKNLTLTNCSFTGKLDSDANTTKAVPAGAITNGKISHFDNNGLVGRGYNLTSDGTAAVVIDGTYYYYATAHNSETGLSNALNNAKSGNNIFQLIRDVKETVVVNQAEGVNIIIDGAGYKFDGTFDIYGNARHTGAETLTFENINFKHDDGTIDFISCNTTDPIKRYAHNVTVENCTFTGNDNGDVVGMRFRQCYDINVINSTFTNMHSLMWATGGDGITIDGVTVTNSKNGVSFGTAENVAVKNSNITVDAYGIRADGSGAYNLTVEDNTINAKQPIIIRKVTTDGYSVALEGDNVLKTKEKYQIVFTAGPDDEEYTTPTGKYELIGGDEFTVYPRDVEWIARDVEQLTAFLANENVETILLAPNTTFEGTFNVGRAVSIASQDPANKATIKGRIELVSTNATFSNVKFDYNDDSKKEFSSAIVGNPKGHPAIVGVYGGTSNSATFENCDFNFKSGHSFDKAPGAITHYGGVKLILKDCVLNGDGNPIYAKTNVEMTGCTIKMYGNNAVLSLNYSNEGRTIVFKNNTVENKSTDGAQTYAMQFLSTNGKAYKDMYFDVQGNTVDNTYAFGSGLTFENATYAEGSDKIE